MPCRNDVIAVIVVGPLLLLADRAGAAGFALKEQSATALGNAFAGATAAAEDPSFMFFNPAALGYQDGVQAQFVLSRIVPRARLEKASATTVTSTAIGGRTTKGDVAEDETVPAFYATYELDRVWRLGLAVSVPFGLETHYPDGWVGRYHAIDSELRTANITPMVAARPYPWLSLGLGVQVQYVEAKLTNAIDFGTIGALSGIPGASPTTQDGRSRLEGDDWGYGFTLGAIVEPWQGTRFGIGYRSPVDHNLKGDVDFTLDGAGIGAALSAATGRFVDTGASARLTTPQSVSFGVYHEIDEQWAVMADAVFTDWSEFDELRIKFDNPAEADNVTEEKWEGSWFFAAGLTYRPREDLVFRFGAAYDQTPIRTRYRTPRIPGNDRFWLAAGLSWTPSSWFDLSVGYTHIFVDDSEVRLDTTGVGNTFRAELDASYDNSIDILTLSANLRF